MRTSPDVSSFSGHRSATAEELMSTDTREQEITWLARSCSSSGSDPNKKKSEVRGGGKASVQVRDFTWHIISQVLVTNNMAE
jgi:hypothetical protein